MFTLARPFMLALAASTFASGALAAATYYVDYAGGNNSADGRSPQAPWKHAPGDKNATGNPASTKLEAGDTVIFRGGVQYHGAISLNISGAPEQPITLDGNSAGNFGSGRAILDGGQPVTGWQKLASADDGQGNPRWSDIFYADVDVDVSSNTNHGEFVVHRQQPTHRQAPWQRVILCDGDEGLLPIAQHPKPADPFYPDLPRDFIRVPVRLDVQENQTLLIDETNLKAEQPDYYKDMFIGVHGGNNHVYFGVVQGYDPAKRQLTLPKFTPTTYDRTSYAFYNSVKLIENPGEWAITPIGEGKSRIYLLPTRLEDGQPANIGFPVFGTGIAATDGASHLRIKGFVIQRYSGGGGGVSVARNNASRSKDIHVTDCEIRFVAGHAGVGLNYCDDILVENVYVHHCPGWTTGVFLSRVNNYAVRNCRLDKNSGSGIRHYECKDGFVQDNAILDHFGMHSSAINVYEGCANVVLERNYIQNTATINRNADNIIFRNNIIDGMGRTSTLLGMWNSGRAGGTALKNIQFINNTFVNTNPTSNNATGILGQRRNAPSSPEGLVIRNNVLAGLAEDLPGTIDNNIFTRQVESRFMGENSQVVTDLNALFVDPAKGDFRRRPDSPRPEIGADIAPPADLPARR